MYRCVECFIIFNDFEMVRKHELWMGHKWEKLHEDNKNKQSNSH